MASRIGKALPSASDKEAEVSPSDIELAKDAWGMDSPPGYKRLLDAELIEEEKLDITFDA
jgi:hypothetical protein